MKKIAIETKIAIILTIITIAIALVLALIVSGVGGDVIGGLMARTNGPEIEKVGSLFGLFFASTVGIFFILFIIGAACIVVAVVWLVWGIVKLVKKRKNKKTNITLSENMPDKQC